ncbi:hypothetical protein HYV44_01925 [Candidatus Microgenomates bacterium]|nr:hypothetical protein [Candidatus Microgenomates bacterium]
MSSRKDNILQSIVEEFITTSDPVGSRVMAGFLGFSPATIRGEMSRLEKEGLICQPHTSAGRIPTEKGYRAYIDHLTSTKKFPEAEDLKEFAEKRGLDKILKLVSVASGNNTAFCVTPTILRAWGLAETLSKKEFAEQEIAVRFARLIDNLPDFVQVLEFDGLGKARVYVGRENAYQGAQDFSTVAVCFLFGTQPCVLGVVGPTRMPYQVIIPYLEKLAGVLQRKRMLE